MGYENNHVNSIDPDKRCMQPGSNKNTRIRFLGIESNPSQPKVQTIRFYTDDSKLIYEETINARLNLKREKRKLALNQLSSKLNEGKDNPENKRLIALAFNLNR